MANLAARDPSYSGPDAVSRFKPGKAGGPGRPSRAWIRNRLRQSKDGKDSELVQILDHQIEVAKSWEVRVVGRDSDGELIKVASGRDSTEAAKFLYGLVGLKPLAPGEQPVRVPDGITVGNRPLLDVISDLVRHRLVSGEMTENELMKWTDTFLSIDQAKIALVFKLLGKDPGKDAEDILRLIDKLPAKQDEAQTVVAAPSAMPPEEPKP